MIRYPQSLTLAHSRPIPLRAEGVGPWIGNMVRWKKEGHGWMRFNKSLYIGNVDLALLGHHVVICLSFPPNDQHPLELHAYLYNLGYFVIWAFIRGIEIGDPIECTGLAKLVRYCGAKRGIQFEKDLAQQADGYRQSKTCSNHRSFTFRILWT